MKSEKPVIGIEKKLKISFFQEMSIVNGNVVFKPYRRGWNMGIIALGNIK